MEQSYLDVLKHNKVKLETKMAKLDSNNPEHVPHLNRLKRYSSDLHKEIEAHSPKQIKKTEKSK
jgi:hypothetical protein